MAPTDARASTWPAVAVCVASAVAGALTGPAPSGNPVADRLTVAALAGVVGAAGTRADRSTWFVAAGAALGLARGAAGLAAGAGALGVSLASAAPRRPPPAAGAAVGGLSAVALLQARELGFHGSSALATAAALAPLVVSGYRHAGGAARARVRRLSAAGGLLLLAALAGYGLALADARVPAEVGIRRAEAGLEAARRGDDTAAARQLAAAADAFRQAQVGLGHWWARPVRAVPVAGHNARAAGTLVGLARSLADRGAEAAADAGAGTRSMEGGRIDLDRIRQLQGPLRQVSTSLEAANRATAESESGWLLGPVAGRLERVERAVAGARPDVDRVLQAVRLLPPMLGGDGPRRWFVAFVTPSEARGRTGFLGNYAEITATAGRLEMTRFGRAQDLEGAGLPARQRALSGPRDYLARWGRFDPATTWRNVTMSPDFPSVGRVIAELYPQSGGRRLDGVIALDPSALAALLRFTGPIEVPGVDRPLAAGNAARFLLLDQYVEMPDTDRRVDALESLGRATFDRLTTGDLPRPERVTEVMRPVVDAGHLQVWSPRPAEQRLLDDLGLDGALPPVVGDSLAVVSNNAAGNKIDVFLSRRISYDVRWDPDTGALSATATVRLRNDAPAGGLPGYVIGSSLPPGHGIPPGTNRTYLSLYTPWSLAAARLDGQPVAVEWQRERGRLAGSLFLDVPPEGGERTVTFELRGRLPAGEGYRIDVASQPLVRPDRFALSLRVEGTGRIGAEPPLAVRGRTVGVRSRLTRARTTYRATVRRL